MDFPHLKDTNFPIIDNVNVYKYQNNFDYARWNGKAAFKLLNVLWNSNYADVPYFNNVEERDVWFDNQDGYVGTLESLFNNTPNDKIRVPIPYNEAYFYNYVVVDLPLQTSENNQIEYEDKNRRVKRWFYFIEDMVQYAPNTTEFVISVDYWTTFIHSVNIPYLMLERGHAPMMQTKVEDYLSNPIANNEYLLADDFNYGNNTVVANSTYKPIGNGTKYMLMCVPYSDGNFPTNGGAWSSASSDPTYGDWSNRWGQDLKVEDYDWHYGDAQYPNATNPITNPIQSGVLNACECYAIEARYAQAFLNNCTTYAVHFIHAIQAMFILDESMFTKGTSFSFRGYTLYRVDRKVNTQSFSLTKNMFHYDSKYENIAKLYTFPYAELEVTDDNGSVFTAKIENTGDIKMYEEVSLIYPFLDYNVFFTGLNGAGNATGYTWVNMKYSNNAYDTTQKYYWDDDFDKFMLNWKIPTYGIFINSMHEYAANNYAGVQAKRARALVDYKSNTRITNTSEQNLIDMAGTNYTNEFNHIETNLDNTQRTLQGNIDNMLETVDCKEDVFGYKYHGSLDFEHTPDYSSTDGFVERTTSINGWKLLNEISKDVAYANAQIGLNETYATATSINNQTAAIQSGWATGISQFGTQALSLEPSLGAGAMQGAGSVINGYVSANNMQCNLIAFMSNQVGQSVSLINYSSYKVGYASTALHGIYHAQKDYENNLLDREILLEKRNTYRFNNINTSGYSEGINWTNAKDLATTEKANILRTKNTNTDNATYARNAQIQANKAYLEQAQLEAKAAYDNANLQKPYIQGQYGGDYQADCFKRRGIRFNIRTQSKAAIAQAGDAFLRFGYALHRVWDMSNGFHYGKHYTFWKAEDIWINDGSGVANAATNVIGQILQKGVTVWRNPNEIGMVGIYDNM